MSSICDERGAELLYAGMPITEVFKVSTDFNFNKSNKISNLDLSLFQKSYVALCKVLKLNTHTWREQPFHI